MSDILNEKPFESLDKNEAEIQNEAEQVQKALRKKRRKRAVKAFFTILVVAVPFLFISFKLAFELKTIHINGLSHYTESDVIQSLDFAVGDSLLLINTSNVEKVVKSRLPYVKDIDIIKKYPASVNIVVTEYKPALYVEIRDYNVLTASNLTVLDIVPVSEPLPPDVIRTNISGDLCKTAVAGKATAFKDEKMSQMIAELYSCFDACNALERVNTITIISRFDIYCRVDGKYDVYLGNIKNCNLKIKFLLKIIEKLYSNSEGKIDVSDVNVASFKKTEE